MSKRTLWCLNSASKLVGANEKDILKKFGHKLKIGDRTKYNREDIKYTDHPCDLMPSCEYFVPIAAKCIGSRFENTDKYPELGDIYNYYVNVNKQPKYEDYWSQKDDCFMATDLYTGYFDILEDTAPNILVGYSEGGLVAKYLAYLDKYVFGKVSGKRVIDAVLTISSPNFGSPLANPANRKNIGEALYDFLHCIKIENTGEEYIEEALEMLAGTDLLKWVFETLKIIRNILQTVCPDVAKDAVDLFNTWINWLSGLNGDTSTSFFDLNILKLCDDLSVLSCINNPLDIPQKAVISTNNRLRDILHPRTSKVIHQVFHHQLKRAAASLPPAEPDLPVSCPDDAEIAGIPMDIDYDKAEEIINTRIMVEDLSGTTIDSRIQSRIDDYNDGIFNLGIKKNAHDFVIPSAYQVLLKDGKACEGNNLPNYLANHMTGSLVQYDAGKENYTDTVDFLTGFFKAGN